MSVAQFVEFKQTGRGGSSRPGGWRGRGNVQCSFARGQTANKRSYLRVIGSQKTHISNNEAKNGGSIK